MAYKQKGWSPFTASNKLKKAKSEMKAHKDAYASLDTSNPYADMENKFEDLTINQKQALFEKEKEMQIEANKLDTVRKSSGGSGVTEAVQALSNQSKKSSQKSSSSIGDQERQNQLLKKQEDARLQTKKRQGEILSRKMKKDKTSTLLGISQQEVAAQKEKKAAIKQVKMDALASGFNSAGSMLTGGGWTPFTQKNDINAVIINDGNSITDTLKIDNSCIGGSCPPKINLDRNTQEGRNNLKKRWGFDQLLKNKKK